MPKPYQVKNKWTYKARQEGFRARSVYKLEELDQRYHLFHKGQIILDVGAAPGSWLQYVSSALNNEGQIIGLDLKEIDYVSPIVKTYVCDFSDLTAVENILDKENISRFDLIISDIAPNTSGIKELDSFRSVELSRNVFIVAKMALKPSGKLVMKVFQGAEFQPFIKELKTYFRNVNVIKADATRDRSREVYVICS